MPLLGGSSELLCLVAAERAQAVLIICVMFGSGRREYAYKHTFDHTTYTRTHNYEEAAIVVTKY